MRCPMESLTRHLRHSLALLGMALGSAGFIATGLWHAAAVRAAVLVVNLTRELQARPRTDLLWPGFRTAEDAVAGVRAVVGSPVRWSRRLTGAHARLVTRLDGALGARIAAAQAGRRHDGVTL